LIELKILKIAIFGVKIDRNGGARTYTVVSPGEKEESSDEDEVKEVNTAKALRAVETVKMWKLQKGYSQDL
jgi:hypothetical protein